VRLEGGSVRGSERGAQAEAKAEDDAAVFGAGRVSSGAGRANVDEPPVSAELAAQRAETSSELAAEYEQIVARNEAWFSG